MDKSPARTYKKYMFSLLRMRSSANLTPALQSYIVLEFNVSVLTHLIGQLQVYKSHRDLVKEQVSTGRSLL